MLMSEVFEVKRDAVVLIQAAAGGVGQLLCQWAARKGALVIGTVLEEASIPKAKAAGCHHVILTRSEDVAERVLALTGGRGANVAYPSCWCLECLNRFPTLRTENPREERT